MNLSELQKKLLSAARRAAPDERVPYAFEKRIMARLPGLTAPPQAGEWLAWSRALWFGAAACIVIAVAASIWAPGSGNGDYAGFSEGIEQAIMEPGADLENW